MATAHRRAATAEFLAWLPPPSAICLSSRLLPAWPWADPQAVVFVGTHGLFRRLLVSWARQKFVLVCAVSSSLLPPSTKWPSPVRCGVCQGTGCLEKRVKQARAGRQAACSPVYVTAAALSAGPFSSAVFPCLSLPPQASHRAQQG